MNIFREKMSMYDNLICDFELPRNSGLLQNEVFQTKDLRCLILDYKITEEGLLQVKNLKHEWEDVKITEYIIFYTLDNKGKFYEFLATIENGICKEIKSTVTFFER